MKPVHCIRSGAAALALSFAALSAPAAAAQDGLRERVMDALADAIAAQGNAALVQIRAEIREQLQDKVQPYLPRPQEASTPAPAGTKQ